MRWERTQPTTAAERWLIRMMQWQPLLLAIIRGCCSSSEETTVPLLSITRRWFPEHRQPKCITWSDSAHQASSCRFALLSVSFYSVSFIAYMARGHSESSEHRQKAPRRTPDQEFWFLIVFKTINKMIFMKKFDPFKNCTPTHLFITVLCDVLVTKTISPIKISIF